MYRGISPCRGPFFRPLKFPYILLHNQLPPPRPSLYLLLFTALDYVHPTQVSYVCGTFKNTLPPSPRVATRTSSRNEFFSFSLPLTTESPHLLMASCCSSSPPTFSSMPWVCDYIFRIDIPPESSSLMIALCVLGKSSSPFL